MRHSVALLLTALAFAGGQVPYAQSAHLSGTVYHSNGSTVPDAPVRAVDPALGIDLRTRSSTNGRYKFTDLPPGSYVVSVNMPCCEFVPFAADDVFVTAGQSRRFDIHMPPGNLFVEGDDPATITSELRARQVIPDAPLPRMVNGRPDLSGVWLTSADPYPDAPKVLPWAAKLAEERAASWFIDNPIVKCLPGSPPAPSPATFITKFVAKQDLLIMLFEDVIGFRQVYLDGRKHPPNPEPTWTGYSVGRWEEDILVIETIGYNDRGWVDVYPRTQSLRMVERYSRPDFGHLNLEVIFDDAGVFEQPWIRRMVWDLAPQEDLIEYVCENNKWADASERQANP